MSFGFSGNLADFILTVNQGNFGNLISKGRIKSKGCKLSNLEEEIWNRDSRMIAEFLSRLPIPQKNTFLLTEYDIPGHLGRCDLLIIGKGPDQSKNVAVIELKGWDKFKESSDRFYVYLGDQLHLIPTEQALGYCDRLNYFHEMSLNYNFFPCVIFTKLSIEKTNQFKTLTKNNCNIWSFNDLRNSNEDLKSKFNDWFANGIQEQEFLDFKYGKWTQTAHFASELIKHLPNITKGVAKSLSGRPLDLTDIQLNTVMSIERAFKNKNKSLFLIKGIPGCGKTIVGLHALATCLGHGNTAKVVLVLRNNRLATVVRSAIDFSGSPRISKQIVKYIKPNNPGRFGLFHEVEDWKKLPSPHRAPIYDLVIADEAHRIPHLNPKKKHDLTQLQAVLMAGRIVVCLTDEGQILNEDDAGNYDGIKELWRSLNPNCDLIERSLSEQHRLPLEQINWLESFLNGKIIPKCPSYAIKIADSPRDVIDFLENHKVGNSCGLLASYTKSNGRKGKTLRISQPSIHWLMKTEDYEMWWRNENVRHRFDKCSSVYGCQGFELDYSGLFWGKDLSLTIRDGQPVFGLHKNHDITDDIGMAYGKKLRTLANEATKSGNRENLNKVVNFLKNRYRILLSRSRKGIIIHCEDPETSKALKYCLNHS